MESVNLLVTIDKNYLQPLCVMLKSYEQTHAGVKTNVYVAHSLQRQKQAVVKRL